MRVADILLIAILLVAGAALTVPYIQSVIWRWRWMLFATFTAVFLLQIVLRRFYWQLGPADCAYLLLAIAYVSLSNKQTIRWRLVGLAVVALALMSLAVLIVLPVFQLPRPTGPYLVGTRIVHLVDDSRMDNTFPSGHRELMVQVWYPALSDTKPLAPYRRWRETTKLSSYDAFLKTHSHLNAAVAQHGEPFPVLLFNHAWGGERTQNTYETEDLASHGYVVISIDHTHNAPLVAFPDGKIVGAWKIPSIDDFSHESYQHQMNVADDEVDRQAKDDIFVLNQFAAMNSDPHSPWYRSMNMQMVGAIGHSFGGATAVETCFRDPRVKAALNMDGWMYGLIGKEVLKKPLFVMYETGWPPDAKQLAKESASTAPSDRTDIWDLHNLERTLSGYGGYVLTIEGTRHMNFSDRSLYSPFRSLTDSGPINPQLAHRIIDQYALAFFAHVLKGKSEPLLNPQNNPYPMVKFARYKASTDTANQADGTARH